MILGTLVRGFWNTVTYVSDVLNPFNTTVRPPAPRAIERHPQESSKDVEERNGPATRTRSTLDLSETSLPSLSGYSVALNGKTSTRSKSSASDHTFTTKNASTSSQIRTKSHSPDFNPAWQKYLTPAINLHRDVLENTDVPVKKPAASPIAARRPISPAKSSVKLDVSSATSPEVTAPTRKRGRPPLKRQEVKPEKSLALRTRSKSRGRTRGDSAAKEPMSKKPKKTAVRTRHSAESKGLGEKTQGRKRKSDDDSLRQSRRLRGFPTDGGSPQRPTSSSAGARKAEKRSKT